MFALADGAFKLAKQGLDFGACRFEGASVAVQPVAQALGNHENDVGRDAGGAIFGGLRNAASEIMFSHRGTL